MPSGLLSRVRRPPMLAAIASAVLVIAWILVYFADPSDNGSGILSPGQPVAVDRPAPAYALPLLSETGSVHVGGSPGSVTVVNFWASWCRACRLEAPDLQSLWRALGSRGVRFVGVDTEDHKGAATTAARSFGLGYPSGVDAAGAATNGFGVFGLPMTYVIGPDQRIDYAIFGRIDPTSLKDAIDSVLEGASG